MYFSHEDIVFALSGNLEDSDFFDQVYRRLVDDCPREADKQVLGTDYPALLKAFLTEDLPPHDKVIRIVPSLTELAAEYGVKIHDFRWWDIRPKLRALVAIMEREDRTLTVHFYWKKASDHSSLHSEANKIASFPSPNTPGGYRVDFEAVNYDAMCQQFRLWLTSPFKIPPLTRLDENKTAPSA